MVAAFKSKVPRLVVKSPTRVTVSGSMVAAARVFLVMGLVGLHVVSAVRSRRVSSCGRRCIFQRFWKYCTWMRWW